MRPFLPLFLALALAPATLARAASPDTEESEEALKARLIEQLDGVDEMEARVGTVRNQVRGLASASELDLDDVAGVQDAAWEARAVVPASVATAAGFRHTWPTLQKTLERFLSKSDAYRKNSEVEESLVTIESAAHAIEADLNAKASDYSRSLESSLSGVESALTLMDTAPSAVMSVHAQNAAKQADAIEAAALAILAIYPSDPQPGTAPARPMDDRQRGWSEAARDALPIAADARVRSEKKLKALAAAAKARLAQARFPAPKHTGGAWTGLASQAGGLIAKAWKTPSERILRVGVDSDWQERREWVPRGGGWSWQQYRFFWVYAAVELDGGRCRVYNLTFRQDRTSSGWSPLHLWGVGNSYEMLLENVPL